ncbi:hypothetical protein GCM10020229_23990 [Kitasatospora albolonga]
MSDAELAVLVAAFESTGSRSVNWYGTSTATGGCWRDVDPIVRRPALMIYGDRRHRYRRSENLAAFVPDVEVVSLDCGHWIQQERPAETNLLITEWLRAAPARRHLTDVRAAPRKRPRTRPARPSPAPRPWEAHRGSAGRRAPEQAVDQEFRVAGGGARSRRSPGG